MVPKAFRVSAISGLPGAPTDIFESQLPPGSVPVPVYPYSEGAPPIYCPQGYTAVTVHPDDVGSTQPWYIACVPTASTPQAQTEQAQHAQVAEAERNKMLIVGGVVFVTVAGLAIYFSRRKRR